MLVIVRANLVVALDEKLILKLFLDADGSVGRGRSIKERSMNSDY